MSDLSQAWFGWIPTNRGQIEFSYIGLPDDLAGSFEIVNTEHIHFKRIHLDYLSDTLPFAKYFVKKSASREYYATADVALQKQGQQIHGSVNVSYPLAGKNLELDAEFVIEVNSGVIEFNGLRLSSHDDLLTAGVIDQLRTTLYILIKTLVHGDAHHHQKIDIALPIVVGQFDAAQVSSGLLDYIKLAERNIKKSKNCESMLRVSNLLEELNGFKAYFQTFAILFDDPVLKKHLQLAENVISSAKAHHEKRMHKARYKEGLQTAVITFIGLFISTSLLAANLYDKTVVNQVGEYLNQFSQIDIFLTLVAVNIIGFYFYIRCKLNAFVYYKYYRYFEFLRFFKHSHLEQLNVWGKLIKFTPVLFVLAGLLILLKELIEFVR
ncbi:MAG: hypothetical protein IBX48_10450 [Thiomicrospira sp.]|uniref:hypothetical protein n=1 Tax=Thiomicrospira sp. TaxID=935 RepID=UPI001A0DD615|nr:hypothetical protein [Thiomicrospira sp.]MBE0494741.1 hypothetical protein [Thiomicrospira sp.]